MVHLEVAPHPLLAPYVKLYWIMEAESPVLFEGWHRILPDGIVEVVFHYGDPFLTRFGGLLEEIQPRAFAISQTSEFIEIRPTGRSGLISVRFFPWGACNFFSIPVSEFADRQIPAEALWGRQAKMLSERIAGAAGAEERIRLLQDFLITQLQRHCRVEVARVIRYLWRLDGASIREFTRQVGVSERQLERKFREATGASPKQNGRLARFLRACRQIQEGGCSLTEVAYQCGYYDQSHFIREFKGFSGLTPRELLPASEVSFLEVD